MTKRILGMALGLAALGAMAGCGKYGPPMRSEFPSDPAAPAATPAPGAPSAPASPAEEGETAP